MNTLKSPLAKWLKRYQGWRNSTVGHRNSPWSQQVIQHYLKLATYIEKWSGQKRYALLGGCLVGLVLAWYMFWIAPMQTARYKQQVQINTVNYRMAQLEKQAKTMVEESKIDPNTALQAAVDGLEQEIAKANAQIEVLTDGQMSPSQLTQLLKNTVQHRESLQLLRLASLSALSITPSLQGPLTHQPLVNIPTLYHHPIELDFQGDFFATLEFLKRLQDHVKIYWNSLEYVVIAHPLAKVAIKLHILSKREHWNEL